MQTSPLPQSAACTAFLSPQASGHVAPRAGEVTPGNEHPVCRADLGRDDLTGLTLGQYDLGRRLGAGGMGLVYEAKHRHLGKTFAVKFIRNEVCSEEAISRFIQEIRTLGTLQHTNVINAVDAGVQQHLPYCVTELLAGHDLASWIDLRGPLPLAAAAEAIRQAAQGLACAHEQNVVHRDIKPSNLFLQFDGTVKVLDFGISVSDQATHVATEPGRLLGTVDFMSPEQIHDAHSVTAASDLYSIGASLFFLLTGKLLYEDAQYPSTVNKLRAMGQASEQLLQQHGSSVPAEIRPILTKLLSPIAGDRTLSASDLSKQLEPFASQKALCNWQQGQLVHLPVAAPEKTAIRKSFRSHQIAAACAIATTLLVGFGVAAYWPIRSSAESTNAMDRVMKETAAYVPESTKPTEPLSPSESETLVTDSSDLANPTSNLPASPVTTGPATAVIEPIKPLDRQTVSGSGRTTLSAGAIDFSAAAGIKRSNRNRTPATAHSKPFQTP